jgi:hypothetical protein
MTTYLGRIAVFHYKCIIKKIRLFLLDILRRKKQEFYFAGGSKFLNILSNIDLYLALVYIKLS